MFRWFTILGCIFGALAVVGNGLVICLIAARRRLHTVANCFVMSLAVADVCIGVYSVSYSIDCSVETCEKKPVRFLVRMFFFVSSVTSLCVMTVERWVAIVWPLKYINLMTKRCVTLSVLMAWIFPLVLLVIPFTLVLSDGEIVTTSLWKGYVLFLVIVIHLVPCLILLVTTSHIFYVVRKHSRQAAVLLAQVNFNHPQEASVQFSQAKRQTREFSSAAALVVVVAVFVTCHPAYAYVTLRHLFEVDCSPNDLFVVVILLTIANSALNPVAYSFLKRDIKAEVKRLLRFNAVEPS